VLGGREHVSYISGDDYHRYGRQQRAELGITPLDPAANHLEILGQHLAHLRDREPILKPTYDHRSGSLGTPEYVRPHPFVVVEGLLNFSSEKLCGAHDIRVFLAPPEELRRTWKLTRDCTRRGYTTHEVIAELDLREGDVERYLRPQRQLADIIVSFAPTTSSNPELLDAALILRDTLSHPDLSPFLTDGDGPTLSVASMRRFSGSQRDGPRPRRRAGGRGLDPDAGASHLRAQRLGSSRSHGPAPFAVLALVQTLLLYHLVSTRAEISRHRSHRHLPNVTGADSALHA
jgi:phosphoribulokinase